MANWFALALNHHEASTLASSTFNLYMPPQPTPWPQEAEAQGGPRRAASPDRQVVNAIAPPLPVKETPPPSLSHPYRVVEGSARNHAPREEKGIAARASLPPPSPGRGRVE